MKLGSKLCATNHLNLATDETDPSVHINSSRAYRYNEKSISGLIRPDAADLSEWTFVMAVDQFAVGVILYFAN